MKVLLLGDIANRWAVSVERVQELVQIDPLFPGPYIILPSKDAFYFIFKRSFLRKEKRNKENR